jgi:hypothetical protein
MKTSKIQRPYYWLKYELPELPAQAASKLHIHACQPKNSRTGFKRGGAAVQARSKIPPASCEFASMAGNDALD